MNAADTYQLLPHGGSMGEGYGPILVASAPTTLEALAGKRIAIPGLTTSTYSNCAQSLIGGGATPSRAARRA